MLRDVTNVSAHIDAYKKIGADTDAVPFGRIRRDIVLSAQEILVKLEPLQQLLTPAPRRPRRRRVKDFRRLAT